jgi:hypothetical protein
METIVLLSSAQYCGLAATTFAVLMFWEKMHLSDLSFTRAFFSSQEENQPTIVLPTLASPNAKMTQAVTSAKVAAEQPTARTSQTAPALAATAPTSTVVIEAVIGAGDLANEKVRIKHTGNGAELSLANWRLVSKGDLSILSPVNLHKEGRWMSINERIRYFIAYIGEEIKLFGKVVL